MRTSLLLSALILLPWSLAAQWELPVKVVLNGVDASDRQVTGLADPIAPDAAVSADAARTNAVNRGSGSGTIMAVQLAPAPTGYTAGMLLTLTPSEDSSPETRIDVNGLGEREIVKQGGLPLDTADLKSGVPARLIYDGTRFVIISSAYVPCPTGYTAGGRHFCVEDSLAGAATFFGAMNACTARNARLCSYNEWVQACERLPDFFGTVVDYEWVDDATNNTSDAKIIGNGYDGAGTTVELGCRRGTTSLPTFSRGYRCCKNR